MFDGRFAGKQPEDFTDEDWLMIDKSLGDQTR
jgi:hypothetical protein